MDRPTRWQALSRWWCRKYNLPSKDPRLAEYTLEELYVEFLEDQIEEQGGTDKFVMNVGTEDNPLYVGGGASPFEEKLARGEDVDLFEGLDEAERARVEAFFKRRQASAPLPDSDPGFADDYGGKAP